MGTTVPKDRQLRLDGAQSLLQFPVIFPMRKILVFIIIIAGLIVGGFYLINSQLSQSGISVQSVTSSKLINSGDIQWYQDSDKQFNLAIFSKPLTITFTAQNAQTLKEQSILDGYSLAVNGSYYRGSYIEAEHSGLLQIKGKKLWDMVPDSQLTQVVIYDEQADSLQFMPTSEIKLTDYKADKYTLFQTGPLLIKNGVVQSAEIAASLNGSGRYLRTVMGVTDDGQKFVLVTRINFTLGDLASMVLSFPIFQNKHVTLVNLDGGTSTAMYSRDLDQFNYQESSRLPVVIGVK